MQPLAEASLSAYQKPPCGTVDVRGKQVAAFLVWTEARAFLVWTEARGLGGERGSEGMQGWEVRMSAYKAPPCDGVHWTCMLLLCCPGSCCCCVCVLVVAVADWFLDIFACVERGRCGSLIRTRATATATMCSVREGEPGMNKCGSREGKRNTCGSVEEKGARWHVYFHHAKLAS
eukprot:365185-Chlamydomonas_euryale.AAC.5